MCVCVMCVCVCVCVCGVCVCYNKTDDISTLDGTSLKLVDKFTYLGSSRLINRKRHRHTANESIDSYR